MYNRGVLQTQTQEEAFFSRYRRAEIMRPIDGNASTTCKRFVAYGEDAEFIISFNVTKDFIVRQMLPYFEEESKN